MSAWYLLSSLGFYPIAPGDPSYTLGRPSFPRASIRLPGGRALTVRRTEASPSAKFVQSVTLNGKPLTASTITHDQLTAGGELVFNMGEERRCSNCTEEQR